jgi:hypothetical protein
LTPVKVIDAKHLASDEELDAPARQLKQALLAKFGSGCAILMHHTFVARLPSPGIVKNPPQKTTQ